MQTLSFRRLGFALGAGFTLAYLGCVFVMLAVPNEAAIRFFNSILHGVDVTTIMRWDIPWTEVLVGVVEVFILGWVFGAVLAALYNLNLGADREK